MNARRTLLPQVLAALWLPAAALIARTPPAEAPKPPPTPPPAPAASKTQHQIEIDGQLVRYTATAGWVIMKGDDAKPIARFGSPFLSAGSGIDGMEIDLPHVLYLPTLAATAWYHDAIFIRDNDRI